MSDKKRHGEEPSSEQRDSGKRPERNREQSHRAPTWRAALDGRAGRAAYVFVFGFATIAVLATVAALTRSPFIFPSLGPTAYMLFAQPLAPGASPRHAIIGHAIGILCGYGALWATGLADMPAAHVEGVTAARVLAAALALSATGAIMILAGAAHPPAGATTLIVALGLLDHPMQLVLIEAAVAILVGLALVINRTAGIPVPLWSPRGEP